MGYRWFDTFQKPAAFAFGHGLSYTTFSIESGAPVWNSGKISVDVTVTNTGSAAGERGGETRR